MKAITKEGLAQMPNKDLILIVTSTNCFSIVIDSIDNSFITYSVCKLVEEIEYKELVFEKVKAFVLSDNYTTLPTAFFDENKVQDYLDYTTSVKDDSIIKYDIVEAEKLVIVWELEKEIKTKLTRMFNGIYFQNIMTSFLKQTNTKENAVQTLFLNNKLIVSVIKDKRLELVNYFDVKSIEDALYYHLLLFQNMGLVEDEVEIVSGGLYNDMNLLLERLDEYFSNITGYLKDIKSINNENKMALELLKIVG